MRILPAFVEELNHRAVSSSVGEARRWSEPVKTLTNSIQYDFTIHQTNVLNEWLNTELYDFIPELIQS